MMRVLALILSLMATFCFMQPAFAFKLTNEGHIGITDAAVGVIQKNTKGETLKFSNKARKEIRDANEDTDAFLAGNQSRPELHFDDEAFEAGTQRLVTLKNNIINNIIGSSPNGASARRDLGGALHTIQDFYAHTNWVELGKSDIEFRLGRSVFTGLPRTTPTSPNGDPGTLLPNLSGATSGYFTGALTTTCFPPSAPAQKTRHGFPVTCPSGLNKDDSGRVGFSQAQSLAVKASVNFINLILNDSRVADNTKAIKALMGIGTTVGFLIDTSGSMGNIIAQVQSQVAQIVNQLRNQSEPPQYLLETFNDPEVGTPFITYDPDSFLSQVNTLFASGGDDCPELAIRGLNQALAVIPDNSSIYMFTDADAKDAAQAPNAYALAKSKNVQINSVIFGSCSSFRSSRFKQ